MRRWTIPSGAALGALAACGLGAPPALAEEPQISVGGRIQADSRVRVEEKSIGDYYDRIELPAGVERNENKLGLKLDAAIGRFAAVADADLVLLGYSHPLGGLSDLSRREQVDPYRLDVHSLYLQVKDVFTGGLDLRVGQQLVMWGVADQFNPTNNLNADDLEDPLQFGDQLGNVMARLDYWLDDDWSLTGVLVPIFKPALLPRSARLGAAAVDRLPMTSDSLRWRIHAEQAAAEQLMGYPTVVTQAVPELPETSFENMQFAYRIGGALADQDVALTYYNGRTDFPQPKANYTRQSAVPVCDPGDPARCTKGLLQTEVTLHYPRMHVYGFNMAGEIGLLKELLDAFNAVGYQLEAALIVPERATMKIANDELKLPLKKVPKDVYDYDGDGRPGGPEPVVVESTPFAKWTVGLDYSFGAHVYANVQWVHGLVDEYGAGDFITEGWAVRQGGVSEGAKTVSCALKGDGTKCAREILRPRLGDYLVLGVDLRFLETRLLARLFTILDLNGYDETFWDEAAGRRLGKHYPPFSAEGFSAVLYPQLSYNFGSGFELAAGALVQLGEDYTKFGDPAAGGSIVWTRSSLAF
ncbi:MAG: hypothetical protein HY744_32650 [Deltaproteobacteria bacterium]|nr:hypothetical protein [Deltaproteobacteria bacterium]